MNDLEELSSLAQVAEIAERYEDAGKYIEELIKKRRKIYQKMKKIYFITVSNMLKSVQYSILLIRKDVN